MIALNSLGDDYPTFPQFQRMLRAYERELPPAVVPLPAPSSRVAPPRVGRTVRWNRWRPAYSWQANLLAAPPHSAHVDRIIDRWRRDRSVFWLTPDDVDALIAATQPLPSVQITTSADK